MATTSTPDGADNFSLENHTHTYTPGVSKYDSGYANSHGGTAVADHATLTITHSLGTSAILAQVFIADDAAGSNNVMLNNQTDGSGANLYDYQIKFVTANTFVIQLNVSGWTEAPAPPTTAAQYDTFNGKFLRVVVLA